MITLYIPTEVDGQPVFSSIEETKEDSDLNRVMQYAYDLKLYNDALRTRIKELENAFGCENCRGNPLTMPMDKDVVKRACEAVFRDTPVYMKNYKLFKEHTQGMDTLVTVKP